MKESTIILENRRVKLESLSLDNYQQLYPIAKQPDLIAYSPSNISTPQDLKNYVLTALSEQQEKRSIPFIIFDKQAEQYAGSTRYMNIDWKNKVLHIGATWIGRQFHGSGLNTHMKFLMIEHAFNSMKFEKVEFRIDERNLRSRGAVAKLGAVLEGIMRRDVYLSENYKRNTCCYGLFPEEWAKAKTALLIN